ncbi:Inhibitor of vertebrate lysozyme (Ivy) [Pseudomonas cuatrocienegasensis]|uniref:Inhibitor of vertebrate lysozyme (Ivy) n=1 Tax=Pseudomonas cuatrocienegasensis TaxID=543360 RepID=A0ABY1BQL6_9PSED|nr:MULTISPECIES: inhibitor of vertebrate lysozyme family protein [Pseudomonas]OEC33110.1 hypothetical protein A7D25_20555 [Pseudomonas sp. 21C1]SER38286.1 Inhibitor of vertebrate lysozyme (Ivy) [Pseudomonas cuatrocienegasensis]
MTPCKGLKGLFAGLMLAAAVPAVADTDAQFRLNELLSSDAEYRETWQSLVEHESRLPEWVLNLSGVATPMNAVEDDGDRYLVGQLCETERCDKRLYVAFSWDKDSAYALYVQVPAGLPADKSPSQHADKRWFGEPDETQQAILEEALKRDPTWY